MSITDVVREKYGEAARRVTSGGGSCCGPSAAVDACATPSRRTCMTRRRSPGCPRTPSWRRSVRNPTALAVSARETVLDLGSGGGIDVLLSARRVGPPARLTAST